MAQKKSVRAGKKPARGAEQKKKLVRPGKAMPLTARDPVKRLRREKLPAVKAGTPKSSKQDGEQMAPGFKEHDAQSMLANQMQLFTTLVKWSPLSLLIRQQLLVNEIFFGLPSRNVPGK